MRNRLGIPILQDLMQIRNFYEKDKEFQLNEIHYNLYRMNIKSKIKNRDCEIYNLVVMYSYSMELVKDI